MLGFVVQRNGDICSGDGEGLNVEEGSAEVGSGLGSILKNEKGSAPLYMDMGDEITEFLAIKLNDLLQFSVK